MENEVITVAEDTGTRHDGKVGVHATILPPREMTPNYCLGHDEWAKRGRVLLLAVMVLV